MKVEEIERIETAFKTKRKFQDRGSFRLLHTMIKGDCRPAWVVLEEICDMIDCNFAEVLDAVNRTTR